MNRREGFFAIAGLAAVTVAGAVLGNIYRKAAGQELLQTAAAVASRGQTQIILDRQETVIRGTGRPLRMTGS